LSGGVANLHAIVRDSSQRVKEISENSLSEILDVFTNAVLKKSRDLRQLVPQKGSFFDKDRSRKVKKRDLNIGTANRSWMMRKYGLRWRQHRTNAQGCILQIDRFER
jgi:hypothetical protein